MPEKRCIQAIYRSSFSRSYIAIVLPLGKVSSNPGCPKIASISAFGLPGMTIFWIAASVQLDDASAGICVSRTSFLGLHEQTVMEMRIVKKRCAISFFFISKTTPELPSQLLFLLYDHCNSDRWIKLLVMEHHMDSTK
jgi:hypothetical protein